LKFACDRCGKRFSSVDEPAPGRVYRVKCRCGNAIHVTAPRGGAAPPEAAAPRRRAARARSAPPAAVPPPLPPAASPHPQATDLDDLALRAAAEDPFAAPAFASEPGVAPSLDPFAPTPTADPFGGPAPWPSEPESRRSRRARASELELAERTPAPAPLEPAPLAADPFLAPPGPAPWSGVTRDTTEPISAPRPGTTAPRAPARPVAPASHALPETSIELSMSELIPVPRRRAAALVAVAAAAAVGGIAGAIAFFRIDGPAPAASASVAEAAALAADRGGPPELASAEIVPPTEEPAPERAGATAAVEAAPGGVAPGDRAAEAPLATGGSPRRRAAARPPAAARAPDGAERDDARLAEERAAREAPARGEVEAELAAEAAKGAAPGGAAPEPAATPERLGEAGEKRAAVRETAAVEADPRPDGLEPAQVQAVIRANRAALDACAARALVDPATAAYAGRKVSLILLVAPSGRAEAALEDSVLDATPLGACLRRAAARMAFPAFRGEPLGAVLSLVIGDAG
jgi:hypothetical protein